MPPCDITERLETLSVEDIVNLTGWQRPTIYRKGRSGEIPGRLKLGRRSVRFRVEDIEKWLSQCRKEGTVQDQKDECLNFS